jgi:hypothetical protein
MAVPYKGQKYSSLRRRAISSGQPFVDPEFPPNNRSLFRTDTGSSRGIEWKRPKVGPNSQCTRIFHVYSVNGICETLLEGDQLHLL